MDTSGPGPAATAGSAAGREAARAVAAAFGLGPVRGDWRPVPGGASHRVWQLRTGTGVWAVKQLNRSREPWWLADHLVATAVEQAAYRAGISMPRPVPPLRPTDGLLADLPVDGAPASFLVHEWRAGEALDNADPPPALADWVGRTLAALHALPVGLDVAAATRRETHSAEEWTAWLDEAPTGSDAEFVHAVRGFRAYIARAVELVGQAEAAGAAGRNWTPVLTHRDVKPDNVLRTPAAAILLDWDGAGRDVAEWEATRAALAFSRAGAGWDRDRFGRVLRAYRAAGGRRVPPEAGSFTGLLQTHLGGSAWMLWRALGHRPVSPPERAAARDHTLTILTDLRLALRHLDTWTGWLRDLPQD